VDKNLVRMGKLTDTQIQDIVEVIVDLAGDSDVWELYQDDSKSLNPGNLRDKILKAKDSDRLDLQKKNEAPNEPRLSMNRTEKC